MDNRLKFDVERMCKVFKVSRSGYYDWLDRKPSERQLENESIKAEVKRVHKESKQRYGSPKITKYMRFRGWAVSRPRVARIMRSEGIRSIVNKKFRFTTTDSNHKFPLSKNVLSRDFTAIIPAEKWVSDITYIPTKQGWLYLTIIMDLFDRKIVGWALSTTMRTSETVMPAWRMAIKNRPITSRLIFHSDRGVQYASHSFRHELNKENIEQSMSRKANCWDNAVAENFFKILKSELIYQSNYHSIIEAKMEVFEFIEIWYHRKRIHSYLGYMTPEEYGNFNYLKSA